MYLAQYLLEIKGLSVSMILGTPQYHYEEIFFLPTFPIKIWIALNGIRISIIFEKQKQMHIFKLEKMWVLMQQRAAQIHFFAGAGILA